MAKLDYDDPYKPRNLITWFLTIDIPNWILLTGLTFAFLLRRLYEQSRECRAAVETICNISAAILSAPPTVLRVPAPRSTTALRQSWTPSSSTRLPGGRPPLTLSLSRSLGSPSSSSQCFGRRSLVESHSATAASRASICCCCRRCSAQRRRQQRRRPTALVEELQMPSECGQQRVILVEEEVEEEPTESQIGEEEVALGEEEVAPIEDERREPSSPTASQSRRPSCAGGSQPLPASTSQHNSQKFSVQRLSLSPS